MTHDSYDTSPHLTVHARARIRHKQAWLSLVSWAPENTSERDVAEGEP